MGIRARQQQQQPSAAAAPPPPHKQARWGANELIQRRSRPAPPNPTVAHRHHAAHHHRLASLHLPSLLSPQTSHWHAPGEQYPYLAIARIDHHPIYLALGPHARALLRLRLIGFFHRSDSPSDARRGSRPRIRFRPRRTVLLTLQVPSRSTSAHPTSAARVPPAALASPISSRISPDQLLVPPSIIAKGSDAVCTPSATGHPL
ncbi:hypothetical protein PANT_5c00158 [Moesziomyces antarcticus T-34]|uniref:Uncharacterized protein n=1 Tax=Pseudozyma antarctica (strain T-34) TaxID=1151754 RepID=M9MAV7_PSEA3|nr:hypothetical protein PANT_5c00158 [Moesziomyces antarcticus T-34]